jgi:sialic acid synthase SpsE
MRKIRVGDKVVGPGEPCFVVAEAGSNHNGSLNRAKRLIDVAVKAGADAVKFQSINPEKLYLMEELSDEFKKVLKQMEFPEDWHRKLSRYAEKKRIIFLSTPTYVEAVDILEKINVKAYKIASTQVAAHLELVRYVASRGKPILMSTGLVGRSGITRALNVCYREGNKNIALLHCNSIYPTSPELVNLKYIHTLQRTFGHPVGFSDHTLGFHVTLAAVALGACVIEKHFTVSRKLKGPDHFYALEPGELAEMVQRIREVERASGDGREMKLSKEEMAIVESARPKLIAEKTLEAGEVISRAHVGFRRSKRGIPAEMLHRVLNRKVKEKVEKGELFSWRKLARVRVKG